MTHKECALNVTFSTFAISPSKLAQPDPTLVLAASHHNSCKISPSSRLTHELRNSFKGFLSLFSPGYCCGCPCFYVVFGWEGLQKHKRVSSIQPLIQTRCTLWGQGLPSWKGQRTPRKLLTIITCWKCLCSSRCQRSPAPHLTRTHSFGTGSHLVQLIP